MKRARPKATTVKEAADPALLQKVLASQQLPAPTPEERASYEQRLERLRAALARVRVQTKGSK